MSNRKEEILNDSLNLSEIEFLGDKIAALSGTSIAAVQYAKRIRFNWKVLPSISLFSFLFSFLGARTMSYLDSEALKPLV